MIKIKQTDFEEIVRYAKSHLPEEACGLIGGTVHGDEKNIEKIYYLENTDHSNEHFSLDVKQHLSLLLISRFFARYSAPVSGLTAGRI